MQQHFRTDGLAALLITAVLVTGCAAAPAPASMATEPVSIQLAWVPSTEYAPLYIAETDGYFAAEGLDVDIRSGGFDASGNFISSINAVASGEADFGIIDSNALLVARSEGKPLVAVATLFQRNPVAFVSMSETGVTSPEDMVGKSLMIDLQTTTGVSFLALLASQGIDPATINIVPRTDYTNDPLVNGEVDIIDAFVTNQPIHLEQAGADINVVLASDYGIEMYPNVIFTTETMISERPEQVQRFVNAIARGIAAAVEDPEAATATTLTYDSALDQEAELLSMQRSIPLLNPAGSQPGMMTDEVWAVAYDILVEQNLIGSQVNLQAAYTLTFLDAFYTQ